MAIGAILFILLLALLIIFYLRQLWTRRHLPPGPLALPLIGTLLANGIGLQGDVLLRHVKQYGNIYSMWIGPYLVVVLSGFKAVKEEMTRFSEEFSDRPDDPFLTALGKGMGIILSNGHTWKQQRHIGVTSLRKLGLGKKSIEQRIEEVAQTLIDNFRQTNGQPFDPSFLVLNAVSNVICALSFGHQFASEDENFQKLIQALKTIVNFIAGFFHMHQSKNDPSSTYNEENLAHCIYDFFAAGTDTSFVSMKWALILLANHPDIQEKVKKEIEDVFGFSRSISYQDKKKLPYTNAVIHEMQRAKYVLLFGVPRQSTKDGTFIVPDLRSVLLDPEQWETPERFNPNHFLDKDGKFVEREEFLAFGTGQRACVGEQLARIELFIFLTSLLRTFSFQLPEGVKEFNETPVVNVTMPPQPYKI
ncbi:putative Cytochrome P450 2J5-like protein, partial [Naja naja]